MFGYVTNFASVFIYVIIFTTISGEDSQTVNSEAPSKSSDWHGEWFPYSPEVDVAANVQTANLEKPVENGDWHGDWFPYSPAANVDNPVASFQNGGKDAGWGGQWFPYSPEINVDTNPVVSNPHQNIYDPNHGVQMGVSDVDCDDAKTNLEIDWDNNPINHTCFEDSTPYRPNSGVQALYSADHIPKSYMARHKCMEDPIDYNAIIPTYGTHRPLWAKYGEYIFLPKQRWVHNLEHGSVVMLYHPCADANEVQLLRNLVNGCLYRHVITPYNLLSATRPLTLVAWGRRLEMSKVDPEIVFDFIKTSALRGPEQTARDGQYDRLLVRHSRIVSDLNDTTLCQK